MLVLATLRAPERHRALARHRGRRTTAPPQPEPSPVTTARATLVDVVARLPDDEEARRWLAGAGEEELANDLRVVNWALDCFRVASADPDLPSVGRHHLLVARIGYGLGEEVADGLWTQARELIAATQRQRRAEILAPQARLAAMLGGREQPLACEELALRARLDVDHGRHREAALQLLVTLDAAIAELPHELTAAELAERLHELRAERDRVGDAAQAALEGPLEEPELQTVEFVLGRIEAALRARAVAGQRFQWRWWGMGPGG